MIDWKDGAVCFAGGLQFAAPEYGFYPAIGGGAATAGYFNRADFQLNKIREGDYIEASELDTEQKYNDAVSVFGLFGFESGCTYTQHITYGTNFYVIDNNEVDGVRKGGTYCKRKITYPQLMAIGKLKRAMIEREMAVMVDKITAAKPVTKADACNELGVPIPFKPKRNKSKQAYNILKSLDYEYDLVKQRWYKKAYI